MKNCLEVSKHPEILATGHLVCLEAKTVTVPKYQAATERFSCIPPYLNSLKLSSIAAKATKVVFQNIQFNINQKTKIPRTLPQATASNRSNVFIFTLLLPERRKGEDWENFIMIIFLPPCNKVSLTSHFSKG
jgi:hypothetical protein